MDWQDVVSSGSQFEPWFESSRLGRLSAECVRTLNRGDGRSVQKQGESDYSVEHVVSSVFRCGGRWNTEAVRDDLRS